MTIWRTLTTGLVALVVILGVSHISLAESSEVRQNLAQESSLETVLKRGSIRVGFDTFKPWAMKDKQGKFIGFEIDVARKLAEDIDVKLQLVPTQWAGIIPALQTGKFDIIIGGMGITPKRNLKVNFTIPYEFSGMNIVASNKKAAGFNSLDDFNKPEVSVAVRLGTTAHVAAKNFLPKATLKVFSEESQTIQELLNGRVHALVASNPLPKNLAKEYSGKLYLALAEDFTKEPIGFAIRKSDTDFLNFLNNWIRVNFASGWLQNRYDYWFNTHEWESQIQ
ncbi:transporter substrate-binding domain-containing protein [Pseudodesulfovibrio senegalensis]|uniref:Transporter substrate-binding domain-containing protein n=1 Tax=Pseudodesulfovibrio senegalensis TaxID=1721087 RepID=A0A6N6N199_9BACT|nr:transporter substrate-binding domain-containing protein [Pseudodesulfovibrio senegalensis]KAB1441152.1 transporter substrate-binding domain-containing protein [Pseudodesulfovibrio senegalensis]